MPINKKTFEQFLNHFTVEVMERAMGLGDRYTTMDTKKSPKNCNNSMIGSLIPDSIINELNPQVRVANSENEEEFEETQSYSNSSYYIDLFLKEDSKGIEIKINLEYWTTPSTPSDTLPSPPYSLRGNTDSPLAYNNETIDWNDANFHLPYEDTQNIGRLIREETSNIRPGQKIQKDDYEISSNLLKDNYGIYQRITLKATGRNPLLYPVLKIILNNTKDIVKRKIKREKLNELNGKKYEDNYYVWFRTTRCQVIPLEQKNIDNTFPDLQNMIPCKKLDGLGEIVSLLFVSPISVFIEEKIDSIELGSLLMEKLYKDPFTDVNIIINFFKENKRNDLAEKLEKSIEIINNDKEFPHAIDALKAVNLTYYNYFKSPKVEHPRWRLFQWTYVIISFSDFLKKNDLSDQFDFIGVRTGGGKTEAYIALTLALGFYSVFNKETPEAITLVRFPRRTLVIDQYLRAISLLTWGNVVLKYLNQSGEIKISLEQPSDNFTAALLLGNESNSDIPYSPRSLEDLYPSVDNHFRKIDKPGTYGVKGISESGAYFRDSQSQSPEDDATNLNDPWIQSNLIQALREFKENHNDKITPAARDSYPIKSCPICKGDIIGKFDFNQLRPRYWCHSDNHDIYIPGKNNKHAIRDKIELFMFRTDEELVRYRSTIVVGTLDKLPHIFINSKQEIGQAIKGCFGERGKCCSKHGFFTGNHHNRCDWNTNRGLFGGIRGPRPLSCGDLSACIEKSFKLIVHDEIHMFDDIVGGLNSPFERVFLKKLGNNVKVIGMSATLSNVSDVAEKLCNRYTKLIYPPEFFFKRINELRRIHIGGLISIPREKRQFKAMHLYIFQVLLTWLHSSRQRNLDLLRTDVAFSHPLIKLEPLTCSDTEADQYLDLLCRWVGYVRKKPNGEILWRDFNGGLESHSRNRQNEQEDSTKLYYGESYYPFFGYISGDYPFNELNKEIDKFKEATTKCPKRIPRALISTNILSVGVDISNLSVILFHGRPEKIAEYVQSSSRVGRDYPGLSVVSFTPSEIIAKDLFSVFSRDLEYRYELIEPSYFNPHSKGIIRETILPILQTIMYLNLNEITEDTHFTDRNLIELIKEIYFDHLYKNNEEPPESSIEFIDYILTILENEYNLNTLDYNSRLKFITPPRGDDEENIFDRIWGKINMKYAINPIPIPQVVNVRSVGEQIEIRGRGIWDWER
jgi:hypothetical protein